MNANLAGEPLPLVLDICAGTGSATRAAAALGWDVVTVDNDPRHGCTVTADVRSWTWTGRRPLAVWCSPPCEQFSRWSMPWTRKRNPTLPDLSVFRACLRIVREARPDYWIVENVRGAIPFFRPFLGAPRASFGPFHLWGDFPRPDPATVELRKALLPGRDRIGRAVVPFAVSDAVFFAIVTEARLFGRIPQPVAV